MKSWARRYAPVIAGVVVLAALGLMLGLLGTLQKKGATEGPAGLAERGARLVITVGPASAVLGSPDYVTDGEEDNIQFQQALDALPPSGGKIIVLAGDYRFSDIVQRPIDNITIEGVGKRSHIARNGTDPIFSAGVQDNWVFRSMRLDSGGIDISGAPSWATENIYIGDAYHAVRTAGDPLHFPVHADGVPTLVVAASDSPEASKDSADYVADGISDEEEINTALLRGNVRLTEGTFYRRPGAPIQVPSDRWLRGEGRATILITIEAGDLFGRVITNSDGEGGNSNIHISDLLIDSSNVGGGYGSYSIGLFNTTKSLIENVWIDGQDTTWTLIYLDHRGSRNLVRNNHLWDSALQHIASFGDYNVIIENEVTASPIFGGEGTTIDGDYNIVSDNSYKSVGDTLIAEGGASYFSFVGNVLADNTVNGIALYADSYYGTIVGNTIRGVGSSDKGQHGIYIGNNSGHHLIQGNSIIQVPGYGTASDSAGISIGVTGEPKPSDIVILGNEIHSWKDRGIFAYGEPPNPISRLSISDNVISESAGPALYLDNVHDSTVSGNTLSANGGDGVFIYNGKNTEISGNQISDNRGFGLRVLTLQTLPKHTPIIGKNSFKANTLGQLSMRTVAPR